MTDLPYNLPTPRSGKRCLECTPARTTFTPQTLAENSDNPSTDKTHAVCLSGGKKNAY